jgi:NAD(P)-dependent dehydrogenase (short-subunit alcohol dehydrogenase family)
MQDSYTNKIVFVTGGTSGIGKATALAFAEVGAKVVLTGRREKDEFAKQGIRVNAIAPGTIATDMVDRMVGQAGEARNWLLSLHPVGRFGNSEEIAAAVLYLASDAARFTTGASLLLDGGWTAQ